VAAHLAGCASCREEYGELSELLPLLASVTESEAVNGPVRPVPAVLGRVLETTSRHPATRTDGSRPDGHRHRGAPRPRRTRFALVTASVVLATAGAGVGVMMNQSDAGLPAGSWKASAFAVPYPGAPKIMANVQVTPTDWGSRIQLKLDQVPTGYTCTMYVNGRSGQHSKAGDWNAKDQEGPLTISGSSSMTPDRIVSIDIDLPDGSVLMTLDHPA
jgi:hypothetical protein